MRLIIEETNKKLPFDGKERKVIIEVAHDDLTIQGMIDDIIRPALLAWGYTEQTVDEYLGEYVGE